jgi:hypothetical protein
VGGAAVAGTAAYVNNRNDQKAQEQQAQQAQQQTAYQQGQMDAQQAAYDQQPVAAAPAAGGPGYLDEIEKLAQLKQEGAITDEEFEAKKKQILGI